MSETDLDLERRITLLAQRVELLEEENRRLRGAALTAAADEHAVNRRQLFSGGAGLLGALTGGALLAQTGGTAQAAPAGPAPLAVHHHDGAAVVRLSRPAMVTLAVTLTPQRGGGHHWARYEWDLAGHFSGAHPPVVVAAAHDDHHGVGAAAVPTCAVAVEGRPGAYRAVIMVNNLGLWATAVHLSALAVGA